MERWYFALADNGAIELINALAQARGVQERLLPGKTFFHGLPYARLKLLRAGEIEISDDGRARIV